MELTIKKEDFIEALSKVQSIVERRTTLPVLSHVLLRAENQSLVVSATDLEVGFQGTFPAQVKDPGSVTIPAKKVYEIAKELSSEDIYLQEKENNWVFISGGEAKYNLFGLPGEDFPGLPSCEHLTEVSMQAAQLKRMIECTIFSTSSEDTMYNTSGVYLEKISEEERTHLRMVSTDGHRLSLLDQEVEEAGKLDFESGIIISKKGITEIGRLIEAQDYVKIGFSEKVGMVKTDKGMIVVRLLENKFPDYRRAIISGGEIQLKVERIPLLEMLRRMSVMSTERHKGVKLEIRPGMLEIYSTNPDLGDAQEKRSINYDGPELVIGFNPRYLIDVLTVLESEVVEMNFVDENSGCLIKGEMDQGFLALVMPMKLA